MNDANESKNAIGQCRKCLLALVTIAVAAIAVAYTVGYRVGVARQEKRLLNEFLVNATSLGILNMERLRELTTDAGTNMENDAVSIHGPTEP